MNSSEPNLLWRVVLGLATALALAGLCALVLKHAGVPRREAKTLAYAPVFAVWGAFRAATPQTSYRLRFACSALGSVAAALLVLFVARSADPWSRILANLVALLAAGTALRLFENRGLYGPGSLLPSADVFD